ncbi:MAG: polyprenyl diphosphate synthase [Chlamydiia bacterium]
MNHVALILDGNRRWAVENGYPVIEGYRRGAERVRQIVTHAIKRGVPVLTMYFFSTENWARTPQEISELFSFMQDFLRDNIDSMVQEGIKLCYLGRQDRLPSNLRRAIQSSLDKTASGESIILNIALDYGGRDEILRAIERLMERHEKEGDIVNEQNFKECLDIPTTPDPDLVIRTGGEMRVSNFLLWQIAYSELFFIKTLWPDFTNDDFDLALLEYQNRSRRRGGNGQSLSRSV